MTKEAYYFLHARGSDKGKAKLDMTYVASVLGSTVQVALTVCSRKDFFSKKEGREKAIERFERFAVFTFPCLTKNKGRACGTALQAAKNLTHRYPSRTQDMIRDLELNWEADHPVAAQKREQDIAAKKQAILDAKEARANQWKETVVA